MRVIDSEIQILKIINALNFLNVFLSCIFLHLNFTHSHINFIASDLIFSQFTNISQVDMKFLQVFIIFAIFALALAFSPDCPSFQQVTVCTPKCKDDSDCLTQGGKCCPNLCNQKSCVNKQNTNKVNDNKCKSSS
jgi:hypothetical protein